MDWKSTGRHSAIEEIPRHDRCDEWDEMVAVQPKTGDDINEMTNHTHNTFSQIKSFKMHRCQWAVGQRDLNLTILLESTRLYWHGCYTEMAIAQCTSCVCVCDIITNQFYCESEILLNTNIYDHLWSFTINSWRVWRNDRGRITSKHLMSCGRHSRAIRSSWKIWNPLRYTRVFAKCTVRNATPSTHTKSTSWISIDQSQFAFETKIDIAIKICSYR